MEPLLLNKITELSLDVEFMPLSVIVCIILLGHYGIIEQRSKKDGAMTDEALIIRLIILGVAIIIYYFVRKYENTHAEEIEKVKQDKFDNMHTPDGQVKCPSCGSTQIQLVNRKWSPATGFLTNKIDQVCVNCKKRF